MTRGGGAVEISFNRAHPQERKQTQRNVVCIDVSKKVSEDMFFAAMGTASSILEI